MKLSTKTNEDEQEDTYEPDLIFEILRQQNSACCRNINNQWLQNSDLFSSQERTKRCYRLLIRDANCSVFNVLTLEKIDCFLQPGRSMQRLDILCLHSFRFEVPVFYYIRTKHES